MSQDMLRTHVLPPLWRVAERESENKYEKSLSCVPLVRSQQQVQVIRIVHVWVWVSEGVKINTK